MNAIHWFEAKQLDRVTNFSSRTEIIKNIANEGVKIQYYCSFSKTKVYFNLKQNISYLGVFRNKVLKYFEFRMLTVLTSIFIVIFSNRNVLMVNQDLVRYMMPARIINKILFKKNKFIVDIRTFPTEPETFDRDMKMFFKKFDLAFKYFDGYSFITPFIKRKIMEQYGSPQKKCVIWSSGVDTEIFNKDNYQRKSDTKSFNIFYHGGISISRGTMNLIKACELLVNQGYDINLTQVGKIVDSSIPKFIEDNNFENWCHLMDAKPISEMPQMIANSDLPVLPFPDFMAWRVSSPIKLMEYMAMGKKVLAPNMECFTDVFNNNSAMIHYYNYKEEDAVTSISNAIRSIIESKASQKSYDKEITSFVNENYTWNIQAMNLLRFCNALCQ